MKVKSFLLFIGMLSILSGGTIKRDTWVPIIVGDITTFVPYTLALANNDGIDELPHCNISNPEVQIISNMDDWQHINDSNKRIFCVNPGNYSDETITITSSGTEQKRRYILLNNANNDHPAKMVDDFVHKEGWLNKFAKFRVELKNANYWTIDRLAYWEDANPFHEIISLEGSSHNVISRSLIVDTANGIGLYNGSNDNKIEKSHMEKTQWSVDYAKDALQNNNNQYSNRIFADLAAMGLNGVDNTSIVNNIFEDNEIINYVDAIQLVRQTYGGTAMNIDFSGTKIIGNRFYVTSLIYTDCHGNFDNNGNCSVSENAIDLKAGSHDPTNPIVIKNNIMFGFQKSDDSFSDLNDEGSVIVSHYHVSNAIIEDNLLFSSHNGFGSDGPLDGKIALENLSIHNNTLYNIGGQFYIDDDGEKVIDSSVFDITGSMNSAYDGGKNINISNNTIVNKEEAANIKLYNTDNLALDNNLFVNPNGFWVPVGCDTGYEDYSNLYSRNISIAHNTFHTKYSEDIADGIPICAGKDTNMFISRDYDFSQLNQQYMIRKFTSNPSTLRLIDQ